MIDIVDIIAKQVSFIIRIRHADPIHRKPCKQDRGHRDNIRKVQRGLAIGHQLRDQAGIIGNPHFGQFAHQGDQHRLLALHTAPVAVHIADAPIGHSLIAV